MTRLYRSWRLWRLVGRMVRIHLEGTDPSLEGIYRGRRGGHYLLDVPQFVPTPGERKPLSGFVAVPIRRVLFLQALPEVIT
jgi:hypothetical protein